MSKITKIIKKTDGLIEISDAYAKEIEAEILTAQWTPVEEGLPEGVEEKDYAIEMLEHGKPVRSMYTGAGDDLSYTIEQSKNTEMPIIRWMEIPA